jgi:hypothetical protein
MAQSKSRSAAGSRPSTKRSASANRPSSRSGSNSSDGSKSRASGARQASARKGSSSGRASTGRRSSSSSSSRSRSSKAQSNGKGRIGAAKEAVTSGAQSTKDTLTAGAQGTKESLASGARTAGDALGGAAQKAKGPALAGGAALIGLAGGLAMGRGGRRRVLGVPVPGSRGPLIKVAVPRRTRTKVRGKDLIKAAGQVGSAGRQVGDLAGEVRMVREQLDAKRRRSPVEVVLEGLTARRSRG